MTEPALPHSVQLLLQTSSPWRPLWASHCLCSLPHSVPSPVLIKKFSDTSKAFVDIMSAQAISGSTSALRWVSVWVWVSLCYLPEPT